MLEKNLYPKVRRWLKKFKPETAVYEIKLARGKSLPFNALPEHQERALLLSKHGHLSFKLPDDSMGFKPYDIFVVKGVESYVVVFFGKKGYLIDIDTWCSERDRSDRKSLTEERAKEISYPQIIS